MVFTPHISDCYITFKLLIGGIEIERVNSCRYLGFIIDADLKLSEHINTIYSYCSYLLKYVGIRPYYAIQCWTQDASNFGQGTNSSPPPGVLIRLPKLHLPVRD